MEFIEQLRATNYAFAQSIGHVEVTDKGVGHLFAKGLSSGDEYKVDNKHIQPISTNVAKLKNMGFLEVPAREGVSLAFKKGSVRIHVSHSGNFYHKKVIVNNIHQVQNLFYELEHQVLKYEQDGE